HRRHAPTAQHRPAVGGRQHGTGHGRSPALMPEQPSASSFVTGIVEGFFGNAWSFETRRAYTPFMRQHGFARYIYAPESDARLRRHWDRSFPDAHARDLRDLCAHYHAEALSFGMGLSPFELYRDFSREAR